MDEKNRELIGEMSQWVNSLASWSVIAHHTFSWEASLWSCRRVYERFMRESLPGLSFFYAIEQNPSRDGHHVHAMWDSLGAPRKATHREWLKRYGRNRIEPVRNFGDVVSYCAKYVVKEGTWWDFHLDRAAYDRAAHHRAATRGEQFEGGRLELFPPNAQAASRSFQSGALRGNA
jgi:hypothetical protein